MTSWITLGNNDEIERLKEIVRYKEDKGSLASQAIRYFRKRGSDSEWRNVVSMALGLQRGRECKTAAVVAISRLHETVEIQKTKIAEFQKPVPLLRSGSISAVDFGKKHGACSDAMKWRMSLDPTATQADAWVLCENGDWMIEDIRNGLSEEQTRKSEKSMKRAVRLGVDAVRGIE